MEQFLQEANNKIQSALDHFKQDLSSIRAGRANPALVENIPVSVYGSIMKLVELGTISAPQHSLLVISIWDASIIKDVEKALMEANLGMNPAVDGQTIRLQIPPLTEERRTEFAKLAQQKGEEAKVSVRQIRQDERSPWMKQKDAGEIGEDELYRREKLLQEFIDRTIVNVDELVKSKQEELQQI